MADAHITGQLVHVFLAEDVTHEAVALAGAQAVNAPGNDTGRVLAAMLHNGQRVIQALADGTVADDSGYTAHQSSSSGMVCAGESGISMS